MSALKNYSCWWCGDCGNSREHKFKRTDIVEEFGNTFSDNDDYPVLIRDSKQIKIQGPNSKLAKFDLVMCAHCNNVKSQEMDDTYSIVMHELITNHVNYEDKDFIDFEELFGKDWSDRKQNFISYFIKHFCCRLAIHDFLIPKSVIDYLNKKTDYLETIHFRFQNKLDLKRIITEMKTMGYEDGFLELGSLLRIKDDHNLELAYSYLTRKWMRTEMFFSDQIMARNFPELIAYYRTPFISYETVSSFQLEQIKNYDDIVSAVEELQLENSVNDIRHTAEYINEYFLSNPYQTILFQVKQ